MNKKYKSFNGEQVEKDKLLNLIKSYDINDTERKTSIEHDFNFEKVARDYGVPLFLVANIETIFAGLPAYASKSVVIDFWRAIPVGMNDAYFKSVYHALCIAQIENGLFFEKDKKVFTLMQQAVNLHKRKSDDFWKLRIDTDDCFFLHIKAYMVSYDEVNNYGFSNAKTHALVYADAVRTAFNRPVDTSSSRYKNAHLFTLKTTIELLNMNKKEIDKLIKRGK
jgi:hypothetical protein